MPELCFDDDCPSTKSKILALDSVYNSVPNHARPLAKNLLSNTLLSYLERDSSQTHSITTGSHPLPLNLKARELLSTSEKDQSNVELDFVLSVAL